MRAITAKYLNLLVGPVVVYQPVLLPEIYKLPNTRQVPDGAQCSVSTANRKPKLKPGRGLE